MTELLLATHNSGKIKEFKSLLTNDYSFVERFFPDTEETYDTYLGNATKKAVEAHRATGVLCLADDSGLELDVLQGEPGVFSARYAGAGATWEENRAIINGALNYFAREHYTGRYVCTLVLAGLDKETPDTFIHDGVICTSFEGHCNGEWIKTPRGDTNFGYDPHFLLENGHTMAELSLEQKNEISHRGMAVKAMREWLYNSH